MSSGICMVCNRPLKDPASIERGMGPVCAAKKAAKDSEGKQDNYISEPIENGLILKRKGNISMTNIPQLIVDHSPDGFEWGYGGSGPSDLALNVVDLILTKIGFNGSKTKCRKGVAFIKSYELYQDFKWDIISKIPKNGAVIPYDQMKSWIEKKISPSNRKLNLSQWQMGLF